MVPKIAVIIKTTIDIAQTREAFPDREGSLVRPVVRFSSRHLDKTRLCQG